MNITFNDGSKNKDISKVMKYTDISHQYLIPIIFKIFLYVSQAIFTTNRNSEGYYLLRCLRHYLNVRMYADFDLHTESTLVSTQDELEKKFYFSFKVSKFLQ